MSLWLEILRRIPAPEASGRAACISILHLRQPQRNRLLQKRPLLLPSEPVQAMPRQEARRLSSRALDSDARRPYVHPPVPIERQTRAQPHPVLSMANRKGIAVPAPRLDGTIPTLYPRAPVNSRTTIPKTKCAHPTRSNPRPYPRVDWDLIRSSPTFIGTKTPAPDLVRTPPPAQALITSGHLPPGHPTDGEDLPRLAGAPISWIWALTPTNIKDTTRIVQHSPKDRIDRTRRHSLRTRMFNPHAA